jgi:hypothetical protein
MHKNYQLLYNPFTRIAGIKSLLLGLAIMLIASVIAFYSHTRFNGVLDSHGGEAAPYYLFLLDSLNAWLSIVIIFYPISLFATKFKARIVDVAGTFLLARSTFLFDAIFTFYLQNSEVVKFLDAMVKKTNIENTISILDWMLFIGSILFLILCTVWNIALNYNAFKVNTNLKGAKSVWIFIVGLLLAEVLSKFIFYYLNGASLNITL